MKISILTLFPEMFQGPFDYSIIKNAREKGKVSIELKNIRDYGLGKHKTVDDTPYGGGHGMVLRVDVLDKAISGARDPKLTPQNQKVVLLGPHGKKFNQKKAKELSKLQHLILICGHYEGVDERVKNFIDEEISVGDFVLTGGEIPAMLVTDAVARLLSGVLKEGVTESESFSLSYENKTALLEHPQYTKPDTYKNLKVPLVLLSGNHKKIGEWRKNQSLEATSKLRPDIVNKK